MKVIYMKLSIVLRSLGAALLPIVMTLSTAQTTLRTTTPSIGSKNIVAPPAASGTEISTSIKPIVVRHPTQAGKVSQTVSGNFVPSASHSWIAKGDKRYSLCALTQRNTVACSPLVATSVLKDIEVGTIVGKNGITVLTFKTVPDSKRHGKAIARAAGTLVQRVAKLSAHLQLRAISYAPKPWESSIQKDTGKSFVAAEGGGTCGSYDDFGYDCEGGGGGGGGDGGGWGGCDGNCDYPVGNDNGDPAPGAFDPTTGEGVDPNAPEVIIVGQRPEQGTIEPPPDWIHFPRPMPAPVIVPITHHAEPMAYIPVGCIPGPRGTFVCPPLPGFPMAEPTLPPNSQRQWKWSDFKWCKVWNDCGPIASESEQPKPPAVTPGERFLAAMATCRAEARAHMEYCADMQQFRDEEQNSQCGQNAIDNYNACVTVANDIRDRH